MTNKSPSSDELPIGNTTVERFAMSFSPALTEEQLVGAAQLLLAHAEKLRGSLRGSRISSVLFHRPRIVGFTSK